MSMSMSMSEPAYRSDTDNVNDELTIEEEIGGSGVEFEKLLSLFSSKDNNTVSVDSILESRDNWDALLNIGFFCKMIINPPENLSHLDQFKYFNWAISRDDFQINDSLLDGIANILTKPVLTTPKLWPETDKQWLHLSWNLVKSGGGGGGGVVTKLRNKLIKNLGEEDSNIHGIVTTRILNKLINAFGYFGDHKSGIEILNKFPDFRCNPDLNTYSGVVYCAWGCKSEDWELEFCQKMVKYLQENDSNVDNESVSWIINLYCKIDKPKLGHAIYEAAKKKTPANSVHQLIHCLSKHDETLCLAHNMLAGLDSSARENATSGLAIRMLMAGPTPEVKAFNHVIKCLCSTGNMERA
ncbi:hypothetical protein SOVF_060740 [Spinacia oleracea]|uniref:Uncharacterized protein n=1 Tax=Spinacia oleracea TaxID=3562 RepID=A0A9R0KBS1_SPIOL|nr:uncharacterized protein LOC110804532 [Spinacia oleracea]KNA19546.1 hypothetical protein SOVF_060740 [Spinacia oleracea]